MQKLKEICQFLNRHHVKYDRTEDNQYIVIKACEIGDNFYDYGEHPKAIEFRPEFEFLRYDRRIIISECCDCCGCAGW